MEKRVRLWAKRRGGILEYVLLPTIGRGLRIIVPLVAVLLLLPLLHLPEDWAWVTRRFTALFLIAGISYLLIRAANLAEKGLLRIHRMDVDDNLQARKLYTQVSVIRKMIVVLVVVLGTSSILMLFEPMRRLGGSILASAGLAGIVLGFAAQRVLGNFLAGIQIALTQPIRIDDVVIVEGEWGRIEEINLTYVVLRLWDLRRLVVPITYFVEKPFQNWTRNSANLLGTVFLYMDYEVKAAVAVARKLTVAVWHILMDHWSHALEVTTTLTTKLGKLATEIGCRCSRSWVTKVKSTSGNVSSINFKPCLKTNNNGPVGRGEARGTTFPRTPPLGGNSSPTGRNPPKPLTITSLIKITLT